MPKKFTGENSKVAAAKERKAAVQAEKDSRQRAKKEEQETQEWAKGAKKGGRKEDQEARRLDRLAKKQEAERLLQEEDRQNARAGRAKTGPAKLHPAGKPAAPPLRGAEKTAAAREAAVAQREEAARPVPEYAARSVDAALDLLDTLHLDDANGGSGDESGPVDRAQMKNAGLAAAIDRHPERRARAAYRAYEDREYERVRAENPGLRMTQIKEIVWKRWLKAEENPLNQALVAHNADQKEVRRVVAEQKMAMSDRLRVGRDQA
ncbi:hypothetical protein LPJ53_003306 [Coemansia erecta]|uniref:DUF1014-domain-containing protein n=1 Tax=Coemansia erecta TaxID=147472 RepID=A0A9W7XWI4_9FUNG|nr:hypothetical protein LPJ53_003306 [Coemansia erecta]